MPKLCRGWRLFPRGGRAANAGEVPNRSRGGPALLVRTGGFVVVLVVEVRLYI